MSTPQKYKNYRLYLLLAIVILIPIFIIKQLYFPVQNIDSNEAKFVGRQACAECHETEMTEFMGSHHDLAMDVANDSTVLGNFNNAELHRSNGEVNKAYKRDGKFFVVTDGEDGNMKEYEVKYVFGANPLQNYLVEFPGGRLQVLALTWSVRDSAWYYMADSIPQYANINHKDWLHWTNQAQNWNSMCAYCHTTGFNLGYNPETDSYHTTFSEIDVSCEACHGPASNHIKWANMPEYAQKNVENYGLISKTSGINNEEYVEMCARCHSRRGTFGDQEPHNLSMYNFMQMVLPTMPQWHVDGQIKDEDYVVASFMQSKMFQRGVQCSDCHNVHSGERKLEGNALCLQCHNADDYDTYKHHHHKNAGENGDAVTSLYGDKYDVGSGTQCVNCHMPAQYYMGVDLRNDHSFRVPRPDLSDELDSPNACTQCHGDKTNKWAADKIKDWHGTQYKHHWGEDILNAVNGKEDADSSLLKIIDSAPEVYPNIVRATALSNLNPLKNKDILYRYLTNENDMLRNTAISTVVVNTKEDAERILPLLRDSQRSIRLATISKLINYSPSDIPEKYQSDFRLVLEDYGEMQKYNATFPLGKYNLGIYYTLKSKIAENEKDSINLSKQAEKYFNSAHVQDTAMVEFAQHLAYFYNGKEDYKKAIEYFKKCLALIPDNAQLHYDLGLVQLAQAGQQMALQPATTLAAKKLIYDEGLKSLEKAIDLEPNNILFNYNNISQVYLFYGDLNKSELVLKDAINNRPENIADYVNLFNFYIQTRNKEKSEYLANDIVRRFPNDVNAQQLKNWEMR